MQEVKRTTYGKEVTTKVTDSQAEIIDLTRRLFLSEDGKKWLNHIKRIYGFDLPLISNDPVETHTAQCKKDLIYYIENTLNKEVL